MGLITEKRRNWKPVRDIYGYRIDERIEYATLLQLEEIAKRSGRDDACALSKAREAAHDRLQASYAVPPTQPDLRGLMRGEAQCFRCRMMFKPSKDQHTLCEACR